MYAKATRVGSSSKGASVGWKGKGKAVEHFSIDNSAKVQVGGNGESWGAKEHAAYIEKGKLLTTEYLRIAMGHLAMPPKEDMGKQVSEYVND